MKEKNLAQFPVVSLFSGAGGMDIGLERAGFETRVAIEIEDYACETLRKNKYLASLGPSEELVAKFVDSAMSQRCFLRADSIYKDRFFDRIFKSRSDTKYLKECEVVQEDIRVVSSSYVLDKARVDKVFMIAGGPPCQPFSKAGKRKSLDCSKNGDLFNEFVRLVREIRPKWFLFENVKGLTFTKTDVAYVNCNSCGFSDLAPFHVRQDLSENGHDVECERCHGNDVYVSVSNERGGSLKIILKEFERAGYYCSFKVLNAADYGAPQIRERLFIVGNLHGLNFEWPEPMFRKVSDKKGVAGNDDLFSTPKPPWRTMRQVLWENGHPDYPKADLNTAKLWVKNVVRPHDEPVTWSLDRPSPTIGAHQAAKLAFAPHDIPPEQLYRQQWATKGRKQGDTPPVKVVHSYLSDEELLRLQTFPSYWYLHGTRMQRAFQIGNAVPPVLAEAIGYSIIQTELNYVGGENPESLQCQGEAAC